MLPRAVAKYSSVSQDNTVGELFYEMSLYLVIKDSDYRSTDNDGNPVNYKAHYAYYESGVYFNVSYNASLNPKGAYATFFHEMGHMIDNTLPEVIDKQNTRDTHEPYLSTKDGNLERLRDSILRDVQNYRDNYNKINGTNYKTKSEIDAAINYDLLYDSVGSARSGDILINEVSDIYEGATNGTLSGNYGHKSDDPADPDYWEYSDGVPGAPLNKETFAHFTEITLLQVDGDMESVEKYLPSAYATYLEILEEAKGELDASRI